MLTYSFATDDPKIAAKMFEVLGHAVGATSATASSVLVTASPASVPAAPTPPAASVVPAAPAAAVAAPPPAPPAAAAPPPAPPPAPEPVKVKGAAPAGWTIEHITSAAKAHADAHGVPSLKTVTARYGEKKATEVDPAQWPNFYTELVAGTPLAQPAAA